MGTGRPCGENAPLALPSIPRKKAGTGAGLLAVDLGSVVALGA